IERGIERGKVAALGAAIETLCEVLEIPLDDRRRGELEAMGATELEALLQQLRKHRRWEAE
ncbi:MAG: hypothetical protein JW940_28065, partial [Polyangiaceae bacterium]|nr:hypothetical protein [Polyangiaceae bacterium]